MMMGRAIWSGLGVGRSENLLLVDASGKRALSVCDDETVTTTIGGTSRTFTGL